MDNMELVQKITRGFMANRDDSKIVATYFAPEFVHYTNGAKGKLGEYKSHLARYGRRYKNFRISKWDEAFGKGSKVVTAYTLVGERRDGGQDKIAVMAVWDIRRGKVVSLREVDAKL